MKPWYTFIDLNTGEPAGGLVCGECSEQFEHFEVQEIFNIRANYSDNCDVCGKNCGSYFNRKLAA